MHQILFRIPVPFGWLPDGLPIYGFGMMLFLAFMLCTWWSARRGAKVGISADTISDVAIWLFLGGILGARLTFLITVEHVNDLGELVKRLPRIWDGGIVLYGALVGGTLGYVLGYFISFRKRGLNSLQLADAIAPCLALGIALGRLGCFLNGCCYGQPVSPDCPACAVHFPLAAPARFDLVAAGYQTAAGFTLDYDKGDLDTGEARIAEVDPNSPAWNAGLRPNDVIREIGVVGDTQAPQVIKSPYQVNDFLTHRWPRGMSALMMKVVDNTGKEKDMTYVPQTLGLHPTQLYETVSMFLLVLLLMAFSPLKTHDGQVMGVFMICYAIHRYLNELLRNDPRPVGFEAYGSILLLAAGVIFFLFLTYRRPKQYQPEYVV
jgi:prolipoprotein diacylglyceryltransferase